MASDRQRWQAQFGAEERSRKGAATEPYEIERQSRLQVASMPGPMLQRQRLMAQFVEYHYPQNMPHYRQMWFKLSTWFGSDSVASTAAIDCALILHQARHSGHTASLVHEARKRYSFALSIVHTSLAQIKIKKNYWALVFDIEMLRLCGHYNQLAASSDDRHSHEQGLSMLMAARGPAILDDDNALSDLLLNFIHCAIKHSLINRRSCMFGQSRWQRALAAKYPGPNSVLLCQVARLGGALERADGICAAAIADRTPPTYKIVNVLTELMRVEASLNSWLWSYYRSIRTSPYRVVQVAQAFPAFCTRIRVPSFCSRAFDFDTFSNALKHGYFWTFMLTSRIAVYDVILRCNHNEALIVPSMTAEDERRWLRNAATDCADALCQTAAWLYCNRLPHSELPVCYSLAAAHMWYVRTEMLDRAEWVADLGDLMESVNYSTGFRVDSLSVGRTFAGWSTLAAECEDIASLHQNV